MMQTVVGNALKQLITFRWKPSRDLAVVVLSWLLVVGAIYTATVVVGADTAGGLAYFGLYAVLGALIFGIGLPLFWTVVIRKRPVSALGITTKKLGLSIVLQLLFAVLQYASGAFRGLSLPPIGELLPLLALALTIGFFEAVFWRGWVLLRLDASFGPIPAIILGSLLYAAYHLGYAMPGSEMTFLILIGVIYALVFLLTRNVFILWPIYQPMGQLVTLLRDGLTLPTLAALGFIEVLILMLVLVWLATRYVKRAQRKEASA